MVIAAVTRFLAARRERRYDAIQRRRAARYAAQDKRRADLFAYEVAHVAERLENSRQLFKWAKRFSRTPEARWAFRHGGRWPVWGTLEVGRDGSLWKRPERHSFSILFRDEHIERPAILAEKFSTAYLENALRHVQRGSFWCDALQIEIAHCLGLMGRP